MMPRALIIDDDPADAQLARLHLTLVGCEVDVVHTLLDGVNYSLDLLNRAEPWRPCLIVIDQHLPVYNAPTIEGWMLAFLLRLEQQRGQLHPHWIAAISSAIRDKSRWQRAREAQCDFILDKVEFPQTAPLIQQALTQPPKTLQPLEATLHELVQPSVDLLLHMATQHRQQQRSWSAAEVYVILGYLADALRLNAADQLQGERYIRELGGAARVMQRLRVLGQGLNPDHHEILIRLLRKESKQAIQSDLPIGRTKLENDIQTICHLLASEILR